MDWATIFVPGVPLGELFVRGTVIYIAVLVLMRLVGQREAGALGITDLLVVVLVGSVAGGGLSGEASDVTSTLLLVVTVLFWSIAADAAAYVSPTAARLLKARPRVLVRDGQLNRQLMRREFMTRDEVLSQLRLHGIQSIDEVQQVLLEPSGMISVVRKDHQEPDQPLDNPAAR